MAVRGLLGEFLSLQEVFHGLSGRSPFAHITAGTFETFIQPGFTILTGLWYVRGEQAQTIALWYCECVSRRPCTNLLM